jgi:hypothetical protein
MMWVEDLMLHLHCIWVCFFTLQRWFLTTCYCNPLFWRTVRLEEELQLFSAPLIRYNFIHHHEPHDLVEPCDSIAILPCNMACNESGLQRIICMIRKLYNEEIYNSCVYCSCPDQPRDRAGTRKEMVQIPNCMKFFSMYELSLWCSLNS